MLPGPIASGAIRRGFSLSIAAALLERNMHSLRSIVCAGSGRPSRSAIRSGLLAIVVSVVMLPMHSGTADAIAITVTDPAKDFVDTRPTCQRGGTNYTNCRSTASLNTTSLAGNDAEFKKSFDAWNDTNAVGAKWTLNNGGMLPGGALNVSLFQAKAESSVGGLDIRIFWNYTGADKTDFFWSQGLFDNYTIAGGIVTPFYEMDVNASETYKPPLYPFQYADRHFFDGPRGPWPNAFFTASAFLSKVDATARTLTVFEGVRYGFVLSVPEPATIVLFCFGLMAIVMIRRRWN